MATAKKAQKAKRGRPVSKEPKTKRYMVRIDPARLAQFESFAKSHGWGSAGAWLVAIGLEAIGSARLTEEAREPRG